MGSKFKEVRGFSRKSSVNPSVFYIYLVLPIGSPSKEGPARSVHLLMRPRTKRIPSFSYRPFSALQLHGATWLRTDWILVVEDTSQDHSMRPKSYGVLLRKHCGEASFSFRRIPISRRFPRVNPLISTYILELQTYILHQHICFPYNLSTAYLSTCVTCADTSSHL